jgi:predicted MPP superfamily phosphohydrolase
MRLWIMSDLHFEFHQDRGVAFLNALPEPEYDAVAIAGDLSDARNLVRSLELVSKRFKEVYYVLGNHECYGSWIDVSLATARAVAVEVKNLHVLETNRHDKVAGATLWFPYEYGRPHEAEWGMTDFEEIRELRRDVGARNRAAGGSWATPPTTRS